MSIILEGVTHTYQSGSPYETQALRHVSAEIQEGEFVGLIGHTGSGKSTLVQHINGLLKPNAGRVVVDDLDLSVPRVSLKQVRQKVGLVFQYPEHQLFEETVYQDIAFGPKNLGLLEQEIQTRVQKAMSLVNLDYETYQAFSPFVLSGGEKRRVAIAGVLAMEPKYLILDEPTAGLDPRGRREIMGHIGALHRQGITVILVTHSMDDVARFANHLLVMHQGEIVYNDHPRKIFTHQHSLQEMGLDVPTVTKLMTRLADKGWPVRTDLLTLEEAKEEILKIRGGLANA